MNMRRRKSLVYLALALGRRSVTKMKGMFGRPSKVVSIADMNLAIACRGAPPHLDAVLERGPK